MSVHTCASNVYPQTHILWHCAWSYGGGVVVVVVVVVVVGGDGT